MCPLLMFHYLRDGPVGEGGLGGARQSQDRVSAYHKNLEQVEPKQFHTTRPNQLPRQISLLRVKKWKEQDRGRKRAKWIGEEGHPYPHIQKAETERFAQPL